MDKNDDFIEDNKNKKIIGYNPEDFLPIYEQTPEEEVLMKIKSVLVFNNDAQAIRILEQYKHWIINNEQK